MKHSKSPIWQKKRKRKFKNIKQTKQPVTYAKRKPQEIKSDIGLKTSKNVDNIKGKRDIETVFIQKKPKNKKFNISSKLHFWLKRYDSDLQLILFPLILLIVLLIIHVFNDQFFLTLDRQQPIADNLPTQLNPYPYVQATTIPNISAKAAIILDRGSQVIIYSKNPQLRFSMASTTKIMTALVSLNYYKPQEILTVKRSYVAGSGLNFYEGEQFTYMSLMYAMLLPSANDAAQAIADNYPGGSDMFVEKMNDKAQSLHLTNTHYSDPVGLDDDGDYSTVVDMARLASYAVTNPTLSKVTSTKYQNITDSNFTKQYQLTNLNELLGVDGVNGIKTGTTEGAKEVLVTSVVKNSHSYIIVVMDSDDRFGDTLKLLNFIDNDVKYIVPQEPSF